MFESCYIQRKTYCEVTVGKGDIVATKSILKTVDIKNPKLGKSMIQALENASGKQAQDIQLSRTYEDVKGDKIRRIFGK